MLRFVFVFITTLLAVPGCGQKISLLRTSIGSGSLLHLSNGASVSSSIGQSSPVGVFRSRIQLYQGFQFPFLSEQFSSNRKENQISIYPNPTRGTLYFSLQPFYEGLSVAVSIHDLHGRLVAYSDEIISSSILSKTFELAAAPYVVSVQVQGQIVKKEIIIFQ